MITLRLMAKAGMRQCFRQQQRIAEFVTDAFFERCHVPVILSTSQNTMFRRRRTSLGNRRLDAQRPRRRGNPFSGFDKLQARSPHPALAATLDRVEAASPAIDRGAAAPLLPLPLPG